MDDDDWWRDWLDFCFVIVVLFAFALGLGAVMLLIRLGVLNPR